MYCQGVAGLGSGYVERPGLRVAGGGDGDARGIVAAGIDGSGEHARARFDGEHRIVRAESGVVGGRNEPMISHLGLLEAAGGDGRPVLRARIPAEGDLGSLGSLCRRPGPRRDCAHGCGGCLTTLTPSSTKE